METYDLCAAFFFYLCQSISRLLHNTSRAASMQNLYTHTLISSSPEVRLDLNKLVTKKIIISFSLWLTLPIYLLYMYTTTHDFRPGICFYLAHFFSVNVWHAFYSFLREYVMKMVRTIYFSFCFLFLSLCRNPKLFIFTVPHSVKRMVNGWDSVLLHPTVRKHAARQSFYSPYTQMNLVCGSNTLFFCNGD